MRIATRCTTVEQFIQTFHRFADEESFFVSTHSTRPPGIETSFSVQLADGTPVLRGLCTVLQAWTEANSPFKTPGVRLGIKRLTENSKVVFEQLLIARAAAKPAPVPAAIVTPMTPVAPKPAAGAPPKPASGPPMPPGSTTLKPPGGAPPKSPGGALLKPPGSAPPKPLSIAIGVPTSPAGAPPKPVSIAIGVPKAIPSVSEKPPVADPEPVAVKPVEVAATPVAATPVAATPVAATPIDVAVKPIDVAVKPIDVAPVVEEPTKVDPVVGERTPGSDLVLPANPLMNISDESLEGYVDCTLYEETGNFFPVEPDEADFVDEVVPPPVLAPRPAIARALTPIPYAQHEPRPPTVTPLPPAPVVSAAVTPPPVLGVLAPHVVAVVVGDHLQGQLVVVAQEDAPLAAVRDRRGLLEDLRDREARLAPYRHEDARHHREVEGHVALVAAGLGVAEVVDDVRGPLVGLAEQHPAGVLVVDEAADLLEEVVGLREVLAVGARTLVEVGHRVEPEAVHAHVDPERIASRIASCTAGVVEVEVGLVGEEPVPEVLLADRVPGPVRRLGVDEDDPGLLVELVGVGPDVEVAVRALGVLAATPGTTGAGRWCGS